MKESENITQDNIDAVKASLNRPMSPQEVVDGRTASYVFLRALRNGKDIDEAIAMGKQASSQAGESNLTELQKNSLVLSIEKWKKIFTGTGTDKGSTNCECCRVFRVDPTSSTKFQADCLGCPVAEAVNTSECDKTPYMEWLDHHKSAHAGHHGRGLECQCTLCFALAQKELRFLQGVLDDAKGGQHEKG